MANRKNIKPREWCRCLEKLGYKFLSSNKHHKYKHINCSTPIVVNVNRPEISVKSIKEVEEQLKISFEKICNKCKL